MMFDQTVTAEIGRRSKKATGSHYTPAILARFVAGKILAAFSKRKGKTLRIMDPAVGDGELLEALLDLLLPVLPKGVQAVVYGFDTSPEAVNLAEERLASTLMSRSISKCRTLSNCWLDGRHCLARSSRSSILSFPTRLMSGPKSWGRTRHNIWQTFFICRAGWTSYYVFIRGIGEMLRPGGIVGLICSNRFMTIKSGPMFGSVFSTLLMCFTFGTWAIRSFLRQLFCPPCCCCKRNPRNK